MNWLEAMAVDTPQEQEKKVEKKPKPAIKKDCGYVSQNGACAFLGLSKFTVIRLRKAGQFPAPSVLGGRILRWNKADLAAWMEQQKEEGLHTPVNV